jgi:predicted amidohydrolase
MKIEITLAQIQSEFGKPDKNFQKVLSILESIHPTHEHLVLLPELWSSGFDLKHCDQHVGADQEILIELSRQAIIKKIWIGGSYLTTENSNYYNTFVLLGPAGEKAIYRKIHLIRLMNEHLWFSPGDQYTLVNTNFAQIGLSICYDLRFPALFQSLAQAGCMLFLMPAAWPVSRINHWNALILARAIETQSFFIACNAVGQTHREIFGGSSAVISPWGECLFQANTSDEIIQTITINPDEGLALRKKFPVLSEQKLDMEQRISVHVHNFTSRDNNTAI